VITGRVGDKQIIVLENGNTGLRRRLAGAGGKSYVFLSPMNLEALLDRAGEGSLVRVTYVGEVAIKSGRQMKSFTVSRAK
jgi:hypothetical protein